MVAPCRDDPARTGVFSDFDGTLSPIVPHAADARPLPGVVPVLESLSRRFAAVVVVSGRPAKFLAEHIPVPTVQRWGLYGAERVGASGGVEVDPAAEPWRPVVADVVARARREAPPGVAVEDKDISVTLHYRGAPEAAASVSRFAVSLARAAGLVAVEGRMSVELRAPLTVDKGVIVGRVIAELGLQAAVFAGDDLGDVAAFRALDAVAHPLRVAVRSAEAPAALLEAADVVVDGPEGVLELLASL